MLDPFALCFWVMQDSENHSIWKQSSLSCLCTGALSHYGVLPHWVSVLAWIFLLLFLLKQMLKWFWGGMWTRYTVYPLRSKLIAFLQIKMWLHLNKCVDQLSAPLLFSAAYCTKFRSETCIYILLLFSLTDAWLASTFSTTLLASSVVRADSPASSAVGRHISGLRNGRDSWSR